MPTNDTRPRIAPPVDLDDEQQAALARTFPGSDGLPLNVFATLAHRPRLLRSLSRLGAYFPLHSGLATRDRELVTLRVAGHHRGPYVEAHHRAVAQDAGVAHDDIEAAVDRTREHAWTERDDALLRFVDELLDEHVVSDATWDALGTHFDDEQRIDLLALVGFYALFSGLTSTLRIDDDSHRSRRS